MSDYLKTGKKPDRNEYGVFEIVPSGKSSYATQETDGFIDVDGNGKLSEGDIEIDVSYERILESFPPKMDRPTFKFSVCATAKGKRKTLPIGAVQKNITSKLLSKMPNEVLKDVRSTLEKYYQKRFGE